MLGPPAEIELRRLQWDKILLDLEKTFRRTPKIEDFPEVAIDDRPTGERLTRIQETPTIQSPNTFSASINA